MDHIDDIDFTVSSIIRHINKWLYVYQNNDRSLPWVMQELQAGLDSVTNWVDKNQHLFTSNRKLLPRRYFNLPENKVLRGRCTTISSASTYMLSVGDHLSKDHTYNEKDRNREIKQLQRGLRHG